MSQPKSINLSLPIPLFLIFVVLKLTNHIDWSWWWITAPLWIPFMIVFAIVFVAAIASSK